MTNHETTLSAAPTSKASRPAFAGVIPARRKLIASAHAWPPYDGACWEPSRALLRSPWRYRLPLVSRESQSTHHQVKAKPCLFPR